MKNYKDRGRQGDSSTRKCFPLANTEAWWGAGRAERKHKLCGGEGMQKYCSPKTSIRTPWGAGAASRHDWAALHGGANARRTAAQSSAGPATVADKFASPDFSSQLGGGGQSQERAQQIGGGAPAQNHCSPAYAVPTAERKHSNCLPPRLLLSGQGERAAKRPRGRR